MNNKLQEKLLLLRAKKYINRIRGIKNIAVNLDDYTQFQWHRDIYNKILSFLFVTNKNKKTYL